LVVSFAWFLVVFGLRFATVLLRRSKMILSAFERKDSPWVWAQFAEGPGERKKYRRLAVRKDDPDRARKVRAALHQIEGVMLAEREEGVFSREGWGWVPAWISSRWRGSTCETYLAQWAALADWLKWARIDGPGDLSRERCYDFIHYRTAMRKARSGLLISKNTAIGELKTLAQILDEARRRGLIGENPARRLGLTRDDPAEKPEITAEEEKTIRGELARWPRWMAMSFHVAISTGLRLMETNIQAGAVRWQDDQILIEAPKGGRRRGFSIPIYDAIRGDLERMQREKSAALFEWGSPVPSVEFRRFFDSIGMHHLCFHCTRVTFITRGLRVGIPENVMMRMVNHGSTLISRIYQRWTDDDVRRYSGLLSRGSNAARVQNPGATRGRRAKGTRGGGRVGARRSSPGR
jgi:hypothetical protein